MKTKLALLVAKWLLSCMTTIEKNRRPRDLLGSIERGLDRMMSSPTSRLRAARQELEREEGVRQHRVEADRCRSDRARSGSGIRHTRMA